jgi:hypothetical protein
MQIVTNSRERTFGYLSAVESAEYGYFGGYLVLSVLGRPLEFHCTAPIRPSRAQEILYGPTLKPYLLGEQICGALLSKAKLTPVVVLTDHDAVLQARSRCNSPMVLISAACGRLEVTASEQVHQSHDDYLRSYELQTAIGFESDRTTATEALASLADRVDLLEPFCRIHEAIREAQRIGGRGTNAHEHAA